MSKVVLKKVKKANSLLSKGFGVIGWKDFGDFNGLLLSNTNSIHTYFVGFTLDIAFLNNEMRVVKLVRNLKPFRFSPIIWSAKHVLEMPEGSIEKYSLKVNDEIDLL